MSMQNSLYFELGLDARAFNRGVEAAIGRVANLGKVAIGAGIGALGAAVVAVGVGAVQMASQMETAESKLTTFMGSASLARDRLDELATIAQTTPFTLDGVVQAEVTLRGFGAAADELLPGLIDFAATTGAELSQSAIDIGKAWSQGATGLESDAGKILRKQVELRLGTDATKVSLEEFRTALLETLDQGMFAGGADRLSRTFTGMVSNLEDSWTRFLRTVGTGSHLFDGIKGTLGGILELINQNQAAIDDMASTVGGKLWTGFKLVAQGAAGLSDAIRAGYGFTNLLVGGMDAVSAATYRATAASASLGRTIAQAAGQSGLAGQLAGVEGFSRQMEMSARARADAELGVASAIANDLNPASKAMLDILTQAEAAAKGTADAVRMGGAQAGKMAGGKPGKAAKEDTSQLDAINAWVAFYDELGQLRETDTQRLARVYEEQLAQARKLTAEMGGTHEDFLAMKVRADEAYYGQLRDMSDAYEEERRKQAEETAQRQAEIQQRQATSLLDVTASTLGSIGALMDQSNKRQKEAYKVLAIAQILISSAVAAIRAFADLGPIGGAIATVGIAAATGASIAQVAQAHQGYAGPVSQARADAPDEVTTRKLRGEAVLSTQTSRALGPQGVSALERGAMGGGTVSVDLRIGRVAQREMIRTEMRTGGRLARELRSAAQSTGIAPGMSGLAAA